MIGRTLSHYEIVEKLGEGGMGVVYRARDVRLGRTVAVKFLRAETLGDAERKWRFVREAKAASALNHPHIVTIHDIDSADGVDFIVMEWIAGASLDRLIANGPLPIDKALDYVIEASSALAAAHAAGIVHRDIKPANLIVTESGVLKVLDFGLAKLIEREAGDEGAAPSASPTASVGDPRTRQGVILGTLSYMSPEQAEGKTVDERSDVFSLGVVLWEMLAGRRAFDGTSHLSILTAILRDQPPSLGEVRPDAPASLEAIVSRCLEKDPSRRYPSAAELHKDLLAARERLRAPSPKVGAALRRPAFAIPAVLVVLALAAVAAWFALRNRRAQWAREVAMPEIARLMEAEDFLPAMRLAREADRALPGDPELQRLVSNATIPVSVDTDPQGAEVWYGSYMRPQSGWERLGVSPLDVRVPIGAIRWKVERAGYETLETAPPGEAPRGLASIGFHFLLTPQGKSVPGMVRVPSGEFQYRFIPKAKLSEYWLDKYEVTNRDFKEFVDRGGYSRPELWRHPFRREGREISREEAMRSLRDATGRPGPATWELGSYPAGREDHPVSGVSWYEAAAFCEFAGKSLPTLHHWYRAAEFTAFAQIVQLSNFGGEGTAPVRANRGLGAFGTFDMAGNVKEWCRNEAKEDHYLAGGAWSDPTYLAGEPALAPPMQRVPEYGLRCAKYTAPPEPVLTAPLEQKFRDYSKERPVADEVFRIYAGLYAYDHGDLAARVESVDDTPEHWRRETVSFRAAYGERVLARLFLPKNAAPPYQTILYFPDSSAEELRSSENINTRWFDFVMRSGRAVMLPVFKGTYERLGSGPMNTSPSARRDALIFWAKDMGRSIDYLKTRRDIDADSLAFYGFSLGAVWGPVFTALEPRFKASIWLGGGFSSRTFPPEAEPLNFAPRVKVPVLMVNGKQDFMRPLETAQTPLMKLLGTPENDKRHALLEGGHLPPKMQEVIREVLDWLDRYLGPVRLKT